ncbi:glycerophosphodiester phosphodiesterase [Lignipirellula cremea]|uniref:Glycerophosphoryl diester phosphodiesterase n=1 Tax=Lignipirellula cremea TaxID=2528010 RepID=A0A518DPT6_9BACT|nr:glycerophosphodiester phosphodiesterase family protein [Lignipirellula cremea]QDU93845.1 Glycerophosphoryl diester phosphodiesterase [Lignipirellula cremea]
MNACSRRLFLQAAGFSLGSLAVAEGFAAEKSPARELLKRSGCVVIAHRGDSGDAPENTVAAFRLAFASQPEMVELDYFHSADGVPVVFHDGDLDRTTNARKLLKKSKTPIESLTLAELKKLDAGSWFHSRFAGEPIPTLAEALDLIQTKSVTLIERKGGDAQTCIDLLRKKEMLGSVVIQSFDWDYLHDCRRLAPDATLVALGNKELTKAKLDTIEKIGVQGIGWDQARIGAADIQAVHDRGLKLYVYTVNDARRAAALIQQGIDGLITNHPQAVRDLLPER